MDDKEPKSGDQVIMVHPSFIGRSAVITDINRGAYAVLYTIGHIENTPPETYILFSRDDFTLAPPKKCDMGCSAGGSNRHSQYCSMFLKS